MNKLRIIHELARQAGYNEQGKAQYKTLAMKLLRRVAKELALPKGTYDLRFNPGGIAVAGDATLHHEKFYLTVNETGVMYRTCKGRKDYTGGANCWAINSFGSRFFRDEMNEIELVSSLRQILSANTTN